MQIGAEHWNLPTGYILGMCVAVVVATENAGERVDDTVGVTVFGHQFQLNELWGQKTLVQNIICEKFRDPLLFQRT